MNGIKYLNKQLEKYIKEDNIQEQYQMIKDGIAYEYGQPEYVKCGTKIGNYVVQDSHNQDLIISPQAKKYLEQVSKLGGYGTLNSCMDSHGVTGSTYNPRHHQSGNKIDLGLAGIGDNIEEVIKRCIPLVKHPATREISLEALKPYDMKESKRLSELIEQKLKEDTNLLNCINAYCIKFNHWGNKYGDGSHIDVLIDPKALH